MKSRSAGNMAGLLKDKIADLDRAIQDLKAVRSKLCSRYMDMDELLKLDLSEISLTQKEPRYLATVPTSPEKTVEDEIELIIAQTQRHQFPRMYQASYGSMISVQSLYEHKFEDYSMLFIEVPALQNKKGLHKQPGETYLRAFCVGNWDKLRPAMRKSSHTPNRTTYSFAGMLMKSGPMKW